MISIRWLVVGRSPPTSSRSSIPSITIAAQPPARGFPGQAPSVEMRTALGEGIRGREGEERGFPPVEPPRDSEEEPDDSGDPVEVAAAGLAMDERVLLAKLLETLGGDG